MSFWRAQRLGLDGEHGDGVDDGALGRGGRLHLGRIETDALARPSVSVRQPQTNSARALD
jgi:hypothetical protein